MTYEEENAALKKEIDSLQTKIKIYKEFFDKNPSAKKGGDDLWSTQRYLLTKTAESYGIYDSSQDSDSYLQYRILCAKHTSLSARLDQSKIGRAAYDGLDFLASITPQHVSGKIYKVENNDGCSKFCLWFVIIDVLICHIIYMING